jgi:hypothetical protein
MTICAAAICFYEPKKEAILTISDRMITSGDIEYEDKYSKVMMLSARIVCMFAGNRELHYMIANAARDEIRTKGITSVADAADAYSSAFVNLRRKRAEARVLAPQGLDMSTFVERQHQMNEAVVASWTNRIYEETLGVQAIVAGTDARGGHIYSIARSDREFVELPLPVCHNVQEYVAIGTGYRQFETHFMSMRYSKSMGALWGLLLMLAAKRKAEASPGVGLATDAFLVYEDGVGPYPPEVIGALNRYNEEMEEAAKMKRDEVYRRVAEDPTLCEQAAASLERKQAAVPIDHPPTNA